MSWLNKLYETYELNASAEGLVPPFHTELNAHVIVTLNPSGNFVTARLITDKKAHSTIIPCTEESSARTSGRVPHPLFDSLMYVAGDLSEETILLRLPEADRIKKKRTFEDCSHEYLDQLNEWCASACSDPNVCIVRDYLNKKRLCADLISARILPADSLGSVFLEKPKTDKDRELVEEEQQAAEAPVFSVVPGDLSKTVVLFEIERQNQATIRLWEDPEVRKSWQEWYSSTLGETEGFCQILGRELPLAELHPKRICNAGDNAKIISGNDSRNFTYRGRFETPMEASAISIEASQKAHSALRWLLKKQGTHEGSQYMVAWAVDSDPAVPDPVKDTADLIMEDPLAELTEEKPPLPDTAEAAAAALNKLLAGYSAKLNAKGLCFIVLDGATPGKGTIAIKLFRDLEGSRYLKNIRHWHTVCAWRQEFGKDKKFYGAPAPRDIVRAAYGNVEGDDPRLKSTVTRLLPCILDGLPIPRDIAECVIHRASRCGYGSGRKDDLRKKWDFRKNLAIACSVYRYNNQTRRDYTMSLDPDLASRDYLYGRLLAVADYLEYAALTDNETNRPTNAMRLMARFAERPYSTWRNMKMALMPYEARLKANRPGLLIRLDALLSEIHGKFSVEDFTNDRPLSGEYLLGYYCQKQDFFTRKDDELEKSENN